MSEIWWAVLVPTSSFAFYLLGKHIGVYEGFHSGKEHERKMWVDGFKKLETKEQK